MLYYQDIVRYQIFQGGNRLGEVRTWDLYFIDFIQVRRNGSSFILYLTLIFRSNDYSRNDGKNSTWKALLLNKVIVGNGKKLIQDDTTLTKPPLNHDSVSVFWAGAPVVTLTGC